MSYLYVKLFRKWRVKDLHHIEITECKKVVNRKTEKMLTYNQRGYFINGKYYKKKDLNSIVELLPKEEFCPF